MDALGGLAGGVAHAANRDTAMLAKLACETFLSMDMTSNDTRCMAVAAVDDGR
jgi:hypothetical protein